MHDLLTMRMCAAAAAAVLCMLQRQTQKLRDYGSPVAETVHKAVVVVVPSRTSVVFCVFRMGAAAGLLSPCTVCVGVGSLWKSRALGHQHCRNMQEAGVNALYPSTLASWDCLLHVAAMLASRCAQQSHADVATLAAHVFCRQLLPLRVYHASKSCFLCATSSPRGVGGKKPPQGHFDIIDVFWVCVWHALFWPCTHPAATPRF